MTDRRIVLVVVLGLAAIAAGVVGGGIVLAYLGRELPGEIITIGASAAGGLATLLSRTSTELDGPEPQPVTIENLPDDPVPVEQQKPAGKGT